MRKTDIDGLRQPLRRNVEVCGQLVVISPEAMSALLELEPGHGEPVLTDGNGRYFPRPVDSRPLRHRGAGSAVFVGAPMEKHAFKWDGPRESEADLCEICLWMDVDEIHDTGGRQ